MKTNTIAAVTSESQLSLFSAETLVRGIQGSKQVCAPLIGYVDG